MESSPFTKIDFEAIRTQHPMDYATFRNGKDTLEGSISNYADSQKALLAKSGVTDYPGFVKATPEGEQPSGTYFTSSTVDVPSGVSPDGAVQYRRVWGYADNDANTNNGALKLLSNITVDNTSRCHVVSKTQYVGAGERSIAERYEASWQQALETPYNLLPDAYGKLVSGASIGAHTCASVVVHSAAEATQGSVSAMEQVARRFKIAFESKDGGAFENVLFEVGRDGQQEAFLHALVSVYKTESANADLRAIANEGNGRELLGAIINEHHFFDADRTDLWNLFNKKRHGEGGFQTVSGAKAFASGVGKAGSEITDFVTEHPVLAAGALVVGFAVFAGLSILTGGAFAAVTGVLIGGSAFATGSAVLTGGLAVYSGYKAIRAAAADESYRAEGELTDHAYDVGMRESGYHTFHAGLALVGSMASGLRIYSASGWVKGVPLAGRGLQGFGRTWMLGSTKVHHGINPGRGIANVVRVGARGAVQAFGKEKALIVAPFVLARDGVRSAAKVFANRPAAQTTDVGEVIRADLIQKASDAAEKAAKAAPPPAAEPAATEAAPKGPGLWDRLRGSLSRSRLSPEDEARLVQAAHARARAVKEAETNGEALAQFEEVQGYTYSDIKDGDKIFMWRQSPDGKVEVARVGIRQDGSGEDAFFVGPWVPAGEGVALPTREVLAAEQKALAAVKAREAAAAPAAGAAGTADDSLPKPGEGVDGDDLRAARRARGGARRAARAQAAAGEEAAATDPVIPTVSRDVATRGNFKLGKPKKVIVGGKPSDAETVSRGAHEYILAQDSGGTFKRLNVAELDKFKGIPILPDGYKLVSIAK